MYVIRSMSTTDYAPQWGQYPEPYHIYLLPEGERSRAYWARSGNRQTFPTFDAALAYAKRVLPADKFGFHWQVVPMNDRRFPTYWDSKR